jgi:hypothetical protein
VKKLASTGPRHAGGRRETGIGMRTRRHGSAPQARTAARAASPTNQELASRPPAARTRASIAALSSGEKAWLTTR